MSDATILNALKTDFVLKAIKKGLSLQTIGDFFGVDKKHVQRIGVRNGVYSVRSPRYGR